MRYASMSVITGLVLVAMTGLASAQNELPAASDSVPSEQTCFRVRNTRAFVALDDRFVYVECVRDQQYLLTMETHCYGLQYSIKVTISNEFDRVCSHDRAWITYRDVNRGNRCRIMDVQAVDSLEQAKQLVAEHYRSDREPSDSEPDGG